MKKLLLIMLLVSCHIVVVGQTFTIYGDKCFGGTHEEFMGNIIYKGDYHFILGTGSRIFDGDITLTPCDTSDVYGLWMSEIDTSWNIIWQQRLDGEKDDRFPKFRTLNNSSLIGFSCQSDSDSSCEKTEDAWALSEDYWVGVCDSVGNIMWENSLGGTGTEEGPLLIQASSGDFYLSGTSGSPVSGDKTQPQLSAFDIDFWVVKLSNSGLYKWDKVYGSTSLESANHFLSYCNIVESNSGELLLTGIIDNPFPSGTVSDTGHGGSDIWLAKLDTSGNILWDKRFGGDGNERSTKVIITSDNGVLICGSTESNISYDVSEGSRGLSDVWLIKLDSTGIKFGIKDLEGISRILVFG